MTTGHIYQIEKSFKMEYLENMKIAKRSQPTRMNTNTSASNQRSTCKSTANQFQISKMLCLHFLLQLAILSQALASGVLELELVSMRLLDAAPKTAIGDRFRLTVCLKEAFTSQLDGPCAFGNTSMTLDDLEPKIGRSNKIAEPDRRRENEQELANQGELMENQGAQLTRFVRIPFSFRWTKSFTIVLTAERQVAKAAGGLKQVTPESDHDSDASANRSQTEHQPINALALIDRHVLTENEVLPSWGAKHRAAWITRLSRSFKTSLVYRFRILCAPNYYGDDCATFCRPRDDQFGHLACTANGQKVCLEGWQGPDCAQARCSPGCNKQHGFCDQPNACQCRPGWTGPRCDECLTYPGCQNGFCLAPWQCVCQANWSGVLCNQDLNYCGSHAPCENEGKCQNAGPGRYKCLCPAGFTGLNCQLKLISLIEPDTMLSTRLHAAGCTQNPCLNDGLCLRVGPLSQVASSSSTPDLERAESTEAQPPIQVISQPYRCQCLPGFTGDFCQWADIPASKENGSAILQINLKSDLSPSGDLSTSWAELDSTSTPVISWDMDNPTHEPPYGMQSPEIILQARSPSHLEMRHLISGVVVASAIGVFCAAILLAWCCLLAIERGKFQLVQMNFIRGPNDIESTDRGFASNLRRVQAKIRHSFRRSSRTSIKPETKLSLDNVLNPSRTAPPSYEESNQEAEEREAEFQSLAKPGPKCLKTESANSATHYQLVNKGALERQLALKISSQSSSSNRYEYQPAQCPKHGHLYRNSQLHLDASTTIEIEYEPTNT